MNRVAEIGCILCQHLGYGETPAIVHHIKQEAGDVRGGCRRASDWLTLPLCPIHHDGPDGIHGLRGGEFFRRYKVSELDLLAMVLKRLEAR